MRQKRLEGCLAACQLVSLAIGRSRSFQVFCVETLLTALGGLASPVLASMADRVLDLVWQLCFAGSKHFWQPIWTRFCQCTSRVSAKDCLQRIALEGIATSLPCPKYAPCDGAQAGPCCICCSDQNGHSMRLRLDGLTQLCLTPALPAGVCVLIVGTTCENSQQCL